MPSERQLSDVLQEFARTLVTDFPIQGILDHLVERIVDVLPITGAGVVLISPGAGSRYVAASDALAMRFEQLQTELDEGPGLAAYETGEAVRPARPSRRRSRSRGSLPARSSTVWPRCSRSRCATAPSSWARSTSTGATPGTSRRAKPWTRRRCWPTSRPRTHQRAVAGRPARVVRQVARDRAARPADRAAEPLAPAGTTRARRAARPPLRRGRRDPVRRPRPLQAGERPLRSRRRRRAPVAVADRLRAVVRPGDTLARHVGRRVRRAVRRHQRPVAGRQHRDADRRRGLRHRSTCRSAKS